MGQETTDPSPMGHQTRGDQTRSHQTRSHQTRSHQTRGHEATGREATEHHGHDDGEVHDHDRGLSYDLPVLLSRRRLFTLVGAVGAAGAVGLAGCTTGTATGTTTGTTTGTPTDGGSTGTSNPASTVSIPDETAGPFPGDGSNGVNVLSASGIVRSDLTHSFGSASGVAAGVPLTIRLTVLDTGNGSAPLVGAAVYLWHCDINGEYSLYSGSARAENYLRGVQPTDGAGVVTFTSIYPAAYSGRWPHIHFEVYPSLAAATSGTGKLRTSQLALPESACHTVYASTGYETSVTNLARTSLATDNVFSDGYSLQLATVTGSVAGGMTASLRVPV
jgi:protocatechuate 3,4-dioxygenase beta subunit